MPLNGMSTLLSVNLWRAGSAEALSHVARPAQSWQWTELTTSLRATWQWQAITDEPLNRSWQRLVDRGTGAKQWRLNTILSLFKTRHLKVKTNDWKTNTRFMGLTKASGLQLKLCETKSYNEEVKQRAVTRMFDLMLTDHVANPWICTKLFLFCKILRMEAVNCPLEVVPKHLNRIEVKSLTGLFQKAHFLLLKPFCCLFNSLLWVVVWLHHQNFCWNAIGGQVVCKMFW